MPRKFYIKTKAKLIKDNLKLKITIYYSPAFFLTLFSGIIGALLFVFLPSLLAKEEPPTPAPINMLRSIPNHINIPILDLDIEIKEASVSTGEWQTFDDGVSYLNISGDLNSGNVILYAHNNNHLFGKVFQLQLGNVIQLKNETDQRFYKVTEIFETDPKDIKQLDRQGNLLTIYTCSGWLDSLRYFVIAEPIN
jgi:LPXTG-site transpeptidase (sortase) family protein